MTTRDLAKMIGLSENTLYKINSGLNEMSDRTAAKICYFLAREKGVSVNRKWLLTGDGPMFEGKEVKQQADNTLRYAGSQVATEEGTDNNWAVSLPLTSESVVIYAYGVRDNTETARVKFDNLSVPTAENVASLITTRVLTESDITLTETVALQLPMAN